MSEQCPECGAEHYGTHMITGVIVWRCGTRQSGSLVIPSGTCIRNQLDQARKRIEELARERDDVQKESLSSIEALAQERDTLRAKLDDLLAQRMDEAEGKLATRPAEAVVGELQAENRRLREALNVLIMAATSVFEDDDEMALNMLKGALGDAVEVLRGDS